MLLLRAASASEDLEMMLNLLVQRNEISAQAKVGWVLMQGNDKASVTISASGADSS